VRVSAGRNRARCAAALLGCAVSALPERLREAVWKGDGQEEIERRLEAAWPAVLAELAAVQPEAPAAGEAAWLQRVDDWYRSAHSGLDCAGAAEAGHFDRAPFTSVAVAIRDLLYTAIWLGMGNRAMVEEIRGLLVELSVVTIKEGG